MMSNDDAVSVLNDLVQTCKDGENGFRTAAEGVDDAALKSLFSGYSSERGRIAAALQAEVRRLGGDPEKSGSVSAALHRGWINIKSTVTGKDAKAIVNECEAGEDVAKGAFEDALKKDLPAQTRTLVQQHYTQVKAAHDKVRDLKHSGKY